MPKTLHSPSWDEIEQLYSHPGLDPDTITQFKELKRSQSTHTRDEGNSRHYCTFFLPYDKESGQIYLGHHIKANDWIPPGGHIELGETPSLTSIREMKEELGIDITQDMLEPFSLSVKAIDRPGSGCALHYDIWHIVHIKKQNFTYDRKEYHDAGWFPIPKGVKKIAKNPDFAKIVSTMSERSQERSGML